MEEGCRDDGRRRDAVMLVGGGVVYETLCWLEEEMC